MNADQIKGVAEGLRKINKRKAFDEVEFKKTQLSAEEELAFKMWMGDEPDNPFYDYRGFYEAEKAMGTIKPSVSSYLEEDPDFHFYSIGLDGKVLKSPSHPTFYKTMESENELGHVMFLDKKGILRIK